MHRKLFLALSALAACAALALPAAASAALTPGLSFAEDGQGAGQIEEPGSGDFAPNGDYYLADFGNDRIDVFSPGGKFEFAFGAGVNLEDESDVCDAASGCGAGENDGDAGDLNQPEDVAIVEGQVFVDEVLNNRISVFGEDGEFHFAFGANVGGPDEDLCTTTCFSGEPSSATGGFRGPAAITAIEGGLWIADSENNRIELYNQEGSPIWTYGLEVGPTGANTCFSTEACQAGTPSDAAGALDHPASIAGDDGDLYVSEGGNARVSVFQEDGEFLFAFGAGVNPAGGSVCDLTCQGGELNGGPSSFSAPGPVASAPDGSVYVSDTNLERVSQFKPDGTFIRAFGEGVASGAEAFEVCTTSCQEGLNGTISGATPEPFGLAISGGGEIWVSSEIDHEFARVQAFSDLPNPAPLTPPAPAKVTPPPPPSNAFKFGKLKLNEKKGTATLAVTVPGAGRLTLSGKGLKKASASAKQAGSVKLVVKAAGKAAKQLAANGKAKLKAKIAFTPAGGTTATQTKKLTLKKTTG